MQQGNMQQGNMQQKTNRIGALLGSTNVHAPQQGNMQQGNMQHGNNRIGALLGSTNVHAPQQGNPNYQDLYNSGQLGQMQQSNPVNITNDGYGVHSPESIPDMNMGLSEMMQNARNKQNECHPHQ